MSGPAVLACIAAVVCALVVWRWLRERSAPAKSAVLKADRVFGRAKSVWPSFVLLSFTLILGGAAAVGLYYLVTYVPGTRLSTYHGAQPDNFALAVLTILLTFPLVRIGFGLVLVTFICLALADLWSLLVALLGKKPLEDEKAHGNAGKATETAALGAARGGLSKPPWADHRYKD
jgi:Na+/melibiose symporter-like transporter